MSLLSKVQVFGRHNLGCGVARNSVGGSKMSPVPSWSALHDCHGSSTTARDHEWEESRRYQQRPHPTPHVQDARIQLHGRMDRREKARYR